MESAEVQRASDSDESEEEEKDEEEEEEEEEGLKNAYSVNDLLGELDSDSDHDVVSGEKDPDCTVQNPDDSVCPDSNVPEDDTTSAADHEVEREDVECDTAPDNDGAIPVTDTYSRVYDEVCTEHIYQDPVEAGNDLMTGA